MFWTQNMTCLFNCNFMTLEQRNWSSVPYVVCVCTLVTRRYTFLTLPPLTPSHHKRTHSRRLYSVSCTKTHTSTALSPTSLPRTTTYRSAQSPVHYPNCTSHYTYDCHGKRTAPRLTNSQWTYLKHGPTKATQPNGSITSHRYRFKTEWEERRNMKDKWPRGHRIHRSKMALLAPTHAQRISECVTYCQ